ncbi:MAG: VanZ family protein [Pseudomonadales bacterium]|nr:VanZ family protein [Pseudomonadales bacterium]
MHKWITIPLVLTLSTLLFVRSPPRIDSRIFYQIWESGHFILFAGLSFSLFQWIKLYSFPIRLNIIYLLIISLVLAVSTEFIQLNIGRSFQMSDIYKDMLGAATGILIACTITDSSCVISIKIKFISAFSALALTFLGLQPLLKTTIEEWLIIRSIPMLSDAESHREVPRWQHRMASVSRSIEYVKEGRHAFKVNGSPDQYPVFRLNYLAFDLPEYNQLNFSVFNAQGSSIKLPYKIYDKTHEKNGLGDSDRFDKNILPAPGWTEVKQSLVKVEN